jgi:N-methylhydantoinase B
MTGDVDSVTLEVVRNACEAIAEEMNATLVRTSYSPNIKDRRDCSCALFDVPADGGSENAGVERDRPWMDAAGDATRAEMVGQAENIPAQLGAMPFSVAAALAEYPEESLSPGDVIVHNDPFRGGAHLPDITVITPIFVEDDLLAVAGNRAHHADIGGARAGSVAADSTEIYQEGLRIPPVKLYEGGEVVDDVLELILSNVRTPDERRGDLRAQVAANETAADRFRGLVADYGADRLREVLAAVKDYSERRMRAEIADLPDGSYRFEDVLDDDGRGNRNLPLVATVTVDGDALTVDFAGTADQTEGPVNAPFAVTASATYYAVRCVTDPDIPPNHGCYRPVRLRVPEGSMLDARPPAPVVGGNLETSHRAAAAGHGRSGYALPERAVAGSTGSMNNLTFGGTDPRTGEPYAFYETLGGGFGGHANGDGMDGVHVHMSNTLNTPAEVLETAYPLRVRRYELRPDTGGAGESRGGLGLRRDIEVRGHDPAFSLLSERRRHAPYGLAGGHDGAPGEDYVVRDGDRERVGGKSTHDLAPGDVVSVRTAGGGGFGDPRDRDSDAVRRDVHLGKVSPEAAREEYGVAVDDE